MKKNSKINLILSSISLSITALLLVMITVAWYATNKTAYVTAGIGSTKGIDYDLTLQRGTYQNNSWTWEDTNDLSITHLQPGDVYYFRFKIDYDAQVLFETSFSEISSSLVENGLIVAPTGYVQINGTNQDWLEVQNNMVQITEVLEDVEQTPKSLYSTQGGIVTLSTTAYNVADTFKLYDYGLGTATFGNDNVIAAADTKEDGTGLVTSSVLTSNPSMRYDLSTLQQASGEAYGYFALEFNDALSTKTYIHLDGQVYSDSNLYQCQALSIGAIALRDITEV
ncbi:hypothetical protein EI71_01516 [Anaeroplasma bactoclasticum]|jgi:hypothetical protein|uniref:Uncharacterized protein n=1 Tax=Anaeroplasma bactoclasticum TaxID=2088 RepID=A0A397RP26_9MOLU|nr:hypothetical protein [Anaeroplasma bactoclasticum]RIA75428.1 hypothetical protein EI71_01516 [Anaeroplasma bactoclasticum]